jgi:hypothetical protein
MALFSIWQGEIGGITLKRGDGPPMFGDEPEEPDAVKILEFQAASWNEACQRKNDHFGWGKYRPPEPGWDEIGPDEP